MTPLQCHWLRAAALIELLGGVLAFTGSCPGNIDIGGFGLASIVPAGWANPNGYSPARVTHGNAVLNELGSRAYFAQGCTGKYNHTQYLGFNLLDKTLKYTTDVSTLGCG